MCMSHVVNDPAEQYGAHRDENKPALPTSLFTSIVYI